MYTHIYRLKPEDISYIFDFAEVDSIIVDHECVSLLDDYRRTHPNVPLIIDNVSTAQHSHVLSGGGCCPTFEGFGSFAIFHA